MVIDDPVTGTPLVVPIGSNTHRSRPTASISDGTHTRCVTLDSRPNGAGEELPT
jgi:hypothetical protein